MSKRRKPRAIREQMDAARKHYEQLEPNSEETGGDPQAQEAEPSKEEDPKPVQDSDSTPTEGEGPQESAAEESKPEGQTREPDEAEAWRNRYLTLQGKYNAEVPQLRHELQQAQEQVQNLTQKVEQMQSAPQTTGEPGESGKQVETASDAVERIREEYGDELADALQSEIGRVQQHAEQRISDMEQRVTQVSQTHQKTQAEKFYQELGQSVPDFMDINADQRFLTWLGETDAMTGRSRQDLLSDAEQAMDAARVAAIFNAWKQQVMPAQGQKPKAPTPAPAKGRNADAPAEKPTYTRAKIKQFYDDKRAGKYRRNPEKARRIEREIFQATSEGRVTG